MASRRMLKAAEAIREVVSMAILTELRDPRVQHVTVTGVEVAPDMRTAKVLVSIMGDEGRQQLCLKGLQNSAGFLQSKVAKRIETRYTPRLTFEIDDGVKKSIEMSKIFQEIAREREARENSDPAAERPDATHSVEEDGASAESSEVNSMDENAQEDASTPPNHR